MRPILSYKLSPMLASNLAKCLLVVTLGLLQVGCVGSGKSPRHVEKGDDGPGASWWSPGDIEKVAKDIADRMVETPRIMNATAVQFIVVDPPLNQTQFSKLTENDIFTEKLITELSRRKDFSDKVFFINRERHAKLEDERKMKKSGAVTGSSAVEYAGADFTLAGKFMDNATTSGAAKQVVIDFLYYLLDNKRQIEVFRDDFSLRKYGARSVVY